MLMETLISDWDWKC